MTWTRWTAILVLSACITSLVQANECSTLPPGVQQMVMGVDITELDLLPLEVTNVDGVRSPVLTLTCNNQSVWLSPYGKEYSVPDQMWPIISKPSGGLTNEFILYRSLRDVRQRMTDKVGGGGSFWKFAFSSSWSYVKVQDTITKYSKYTSDVSVFDSSTQVKFRPSHNIQLNSEAKAFIEGITGDFKSNPEPYKHFIEEFGTHYFGRANFGGYIRVLFETNSKYFYSKSENDAQVNAQASFMNIISLNGGHGTGSTTVDDNFSSESSQSVRYFGGTTNLLQSSGIEQWQPTVDEEPWLYSGKLTPISELIPDEAKRVSMEEAVQNHIMLSYLAELERLVDTGKTKTSDAILGILQNQINDMRSKPLLVETDVEVLGRDVEDNVVVPSWFTLNTELCFKWRADEDSAQCSGQSAGNPCAKPNDMTTFYRDDTDRRGGGCRMSWGIKTAGQAPWFNSVQICYRWYADGDKGQCGGQDSGNYCAGINNFTTEYRDDSDRRGGGCQMSWMLVVPSSAPLWMKKTQLCFHWQADGDAAQCSGPSNDLCAYANQWTEYYRDDTDRRGGGCKLSWGLKSDFLPH